MISRPYTHIVGTCCTVNADTLLETLVIFIKCTEQCFVLRSDTLIGVLGGGELTEEMYE